MVDLRVHRGPHELAIECSGIVVADRAGTESAQLVLGIDGVAARVGLATFFGGTIFLFS